MTELVLRSWRRSGVYDLATGTVRDGRLDGSVDIALRDRANPADRIERSVPFVIAGPRDVVGLEPRAIRKQTPAPQTLDAETTKAVQVEFAESDLPWRYTPEPAIGERLRPWLVLLVGVLGDEIALLPDQRVQVSAEVLNDYDLRRSARWAHVDQTTGRPVARLLAPRPLIPNAEHVAVVVPAFDENGQDSWSTPAGAASVLPAYFYWSFKADDAGDFVSLAARLRPKLPPGGLGRAPLRYDRIDPAADLDAMGVLAPVGTGLDPLPAPVGVDVQALRALPADPRGRPIIGLPDYGRDWLAQGLNSPWSATLNQDPRHRIAAGLGRKAGIFLQDELAGAAETMAGALDFAHRLIGNLMFGRNAAMSLWRRRLPGNTLATLWLLGPSSRRVVTPSGTIYARVADPDRSLPVSLLSSTAARRTLRPGGLIGRRARAGAVEPARLLDVANRCPPPPPKSPPGMPHGDLLKRGGVERFLEAGAAGKVDGKALLNRLRDLDLRDCPPDVLRAIKILLERMRTQLDQGAGLPIATLVTLLNLLDGKKGDDDKLVERILALLEAFDEADDQKDLSQLATDLLIRGRERVCEPIDLQRLAAGMTAAFDPNTPSAAAVQRVRTRLRGIDEPMLQSQRFCPVLDLPLWRYMRDEALDWLLPGASGIQKNDVVAVRTNPSFIDAFMVGVNRQALAEFRWRNIRVASRCTPLRRFWDQIDPNSGLKLDDILPIEDWPLASTLGASSHQPPTDSVADLVVIFKSALFERYPETLIYLVPAVLDGLGEPDFDQEPDLTSGHLFPIFQGRIGDDATFFGFDLSPVAGRRHWIVLEEPAPGYRFRTVAAQSWAADPPRLAAFSAARNDPFVPGAAYASATFNDPTRVLIRGNALIAETS